MKSKCIECGVEFDSPRGARFCSRQHRQAFHNRRMIRGAELYDAMMANRFDRPWARTVRLFQMLSRLMSDWRAEDREAGRESYIRPDAWVKANSALLRSSRHQVVVGRRAA